MPSPRRAHAIRPTLLCIALAAALQSGSAWAVEPFVLKDIRVEGLIFELFVAGVGVAMLVAVPVVWGLIKKLHGLPVRGAPTIAQLDQ